MPVSILGQHAQTAMPVCMRRQHSPTATAVPMLGQCPTTIMAVCMLGQHAPTAIGCLHAWSAHPHCHWLSPCLVSNHPPPWLSPCLASTHPPPWLSPCLASNHLPPLLFSLRNPRVVPEMHSLTGWFAAAGSRPHVCYSNRDRARRTRTTTTRKFCQQAPFPRPGME